MALPIAPNQYSKNDEQETRRQIDQRMNQLERRPAGSGNITPVTPSVTPIELRTIESGVSYETQTASNRVNKSWGVWIRGTATTVIPIQRTGVLVSNLSARFGTAFDTGQTLFTGGFAVNAVININAFLNANDGDVVHTQVVDSSTGIGSQLIKQNATSMIFRAYRQPDAIGSIVDNLISRITLRWREQDTQGHDFSKLVDIGANIDEFEHNLYFFNYIRSSGIRATSGSFTSNDLRNLTPQTAGTAVSGLDATEAIKLPIINFRDGWLAVTIDSNRNILVGINNWTHALYPSPEFLLRELTITGTGIETGSQEPVIVNAPIQGLNATDHMTLRSNYTATRIDLNKYFFISGTTRYNFSIPQSLGNTGDEILINSVNPVNVIQNSGGINAATYILAAGDRYYFKKLDDLWRLLSTS